MPPPAADLLRARLGRLAHGLAQHEVDALVVTHLPNIEYLTGFRASAGMAVAFADRVQLIADSRYADALRQQADAVPFVEPVPLPTELSYEQQVVRLLLDMGGRVGLEAAHLTLAQYRHLETALAAASPGPTLRELTGVVEALRLQKDAWEVQCLRDGAARLSQVAKCILPKVLAGRTEAEVAADIDDELRRCGFERPAFDTIVAAGANGARPHARAGGRRIEGGSLVVVDFGGVYNGYCTDMTRTVAVGPVTAEQRQRLEWVAAAQRAAFAAVAPGRRPEDADAAAREVLSRAGVGEAFLHGTGHGLGLELHEAPRVGRERTGVREPLFAPGVVVTLEPGVYFPEWGGIRIEDDVLVTDTGAEWLTEPSS